MEWPGLKRTTTLMQFQPPAMCRVANQQTRLPRATSSLALNACRDGASTPPWATCSVRHHPLGEKLPPNIQTKPPLSQFNTIALSLSTLINSRFPSCLYTPSWILGKASSWKERSGTGTGCPGKWWSHHLWRCSRTVEMWHLETWLVGMAGMD